MSSDPLILNTLRKLMRPRTVLRADFDVSHDHGMLNSHFTLELARSAEGAVSVIELCKDGEFVAARALAHHEANHELDDRLLARAMYTLWGDNEEQDSRHIIAASGSCVLLDATPASSNRRMLAWQYRDLVDGGLLEVWQGDGPRVSSKIARPLAGNLRSSIYSLQHQASQTFRLLQRTQAKPSRRGQA